MSKDLTVTISVREILDSTSKDDVDCVVHDAIFACESLLREAFEFPIPDGFKKNVKFENSSEEDGKTSVVCTVTATPNSSESM